VRTRPLGPILVVLALVLAACGGADDAAPDDRTSAAPGDADCDWSIEAPSTDFVVDRCGRALILRGVNVESAGAGPCAEPVALGAAISAGEQGLLAIVAVGGFDAPGYVLNPCGNCRQMMIDYAPDMLVIVGDEHGAHFKVRARDLLPFAYRHFDGDPP